ncbi:hypothetical protein [Chitinilyticum piscinae]|uniref:Ribosomal protein L7/L12 C-terminal domain-containing protein n=1 Tax=Chitinilyticum piscinae TaxID=2866724 RepID=A0A8J7K8T1_9NEIS|nr:hypothetical protein [Chitinilyticum piscinae]MBE9610093.1 hypothetical protein [Chitinilyticum piscinae]
MQEQDVVVSTAVHAELAKGNKIAAIKRLRTEQGLGLQEAKEQIERYLVRHPGLMPPTQPISNQGLLMLLAILIVAVLIYSSL